MQQNTTETLFGVVNKDGNVFIDSFARTQEFAQKSFSDSIGKPWLLCVQEDKVAVQQLVSMSVI